MAERNLEQARYGDSADTALIRPETSDLGKELYEDEPRGSLVLLLLFLAAMVGVWLYVYFLLLDRTT